MSPIIKEPDGLEPAQIDAESGATPFPEDINARSNALQPSDVATSKSANCTENAVKGKAKTDVNASAVRGSPERKKSAPRTPQVVRKSASGDTKRGSDLKRSQSLRTRTKPSVHQNEGNKKTEPLVPVSGEKCPVAPLSKQNKLGRFQMFKNRFSVFPKSSANEEGDASFHNLRRSQSMRIPSKKSGSTSSSSGRNTSPLKATPENVNENSVSKDSKLRTKAAIKNSKSLSDVRQPYKKINQPLATSQNGALNNAVKRPATNINNRLATLTSKIRNSSEVISTEKGTSTSKTFAHKTIDVIRKSVQSKFKVEKREKKKVDPVSPKPKSKSSVTDNSPQKPTKIENSSSKDKVKMNSKRKKNEGNESDSECKPKKRVSSNLKEKANHDLKGRLSKENRMNSTLVSKEKPKVKQHNLETANNKNKEKSVLKVNNKKMKENKTTLLNKKNNNCEKIKNVDNLHANNSSKMLNASKNINYTSTESNRVPNPVSEIQSHHALFLNNIHETLNNSCRKKHDTIPSKNLNLNEESLFGEKKLSETLNRNIYEMISSRFSNSLPFILAEFDIKSNKTMNNQMEESNLTKSYSETCISERSLTLSLQEVDMKSMSPMSISNDDDERSKTELQSPMSFTNYDDPYIDESMDDYWCEGDEESYFGTLFAESKLIWESFSESFNDIDVELGSFTLDDDILLNNREQTEIGLDQSLDFDPNFLLENLRMESSTPTSIGNDLQNYSLCPKVIMKNDETCSNKFNKSNNAIDVPEFDNKNTLLASPKSLESIQEPSNANPEKRLKLKNQPKQKSPILKEEGRPIPTEAKVKRPQNLNVSQTEPGSRRKKSENILKPNSINSTNRIKKIKESSKTSPIADGKLGSVLNTGYIKKKALSEACIVQTNAKHSSLRKEKSELESQRRKGDERADTAKSFSSSSSVQKEGAKKSLKSDAKNEDEKKLKQEGPPAGPRQGNAGLAKPLRGTPSRAKQTDPVKVLRPTGPTTPATGPTDPPPSSASERLKRLEAELSQRTQEALTAKEEAARTSKGVEALTVLVHYLTKEYDAFSTPRFKAESQRLTSQLTDVRLCLDESSASARRLENEATERCQKQAEEIQKLEEVHRQEISSISNEHQIKSEEVLEKHQQELKELLSKEESQRDGILKSHTEELERIDYEWRSQMDQQHERHLQALEQLNTCHTQQLRDAEASWESREKELQETNARLLKEQSSLKQQAKRLEETLLSDKDHRLQAAKRLCTALQNEVDSLKTVIEMRNSEVHKLRDQLADKERITEELDVARERVRALQAKTEDLNAQMEKKLQLERQLLADHHSISDSLQREASINKRLLLDNEELQWKLRQREAACGSLPTSTLDLVTRCSSAIARQQEGCKTGVLSPQFTPRAQRIGTRPHDKKWSQSFSNIPEDAGKHLRRCELSDVTLESPPPSPRVKAVIEKSNSVSFILDLNDTFPEDPYSGGAPPPKKPSTPNLQRKSLRKTFSNNLEKSSSTSLLQRGSHCFPKLNDAPPPPSFNGGAVGGNDPFRKDTPPTYDRVHSTSESSDSGDVERVSPTGLAWTVPVHPAVKRFSKHLPGGRFHQRVPPEPPRLLQQPDEDEYEEEEMEDEFVQVLSLADDLSSSAPLTTLFAQTPSTSVSLSDSDVSQCGSRADLSSDDDDLSDQDDDGTLLQKDYRPQEGAGEAMIFPDVFELKGEKGGIDQLKKSCKEISKSQISSAPSSDSEDVHQPMNDALNMSWSEDVECDLTSSSEMQELL